MPKTKPTKPAPDDAAGANPTVDLCRGLTDVSAALTAVVTDLRAQVEALRRRVARLERARRKE